MAHAKKKGRKALHQMRSSAGALAAHYAPTITAKESYLALLAAWEYFAEHGYLPGANDKLPPQTPARGQKASCEARDAAKALVNLYGPALDSLSSSSCINPEADPEDQIFMSAERAAHVLLDAMTRLAKTGWLVETDVKLERFTIWYDFKRIRPRFRSTKAALDELVKIHPRSIRDLERIVSGRDWR